jgi:hypothetical protein
MKINFLTNKGNIIFEKTNEKIEIFSDNIKIIFENPLSNASAFIEDISTEIKREVSDLGESHADSVMETLVNFYAYVRNNVINVFSNLPLNVENIPFFDKNYSLFKITDSNGTYEKEKDSYLFTEINDYYNFRFNKNGHFLCALHSGFYSEEQIFEFFCQVQENFGFFV